MKKLAAIAAVMLIGAGCTSTVTLGPKANESTIVGASADAGSASVSLPLVKASVGTTTASKKK